MKISPVAGTPTIPNLSPTGLSPDKLAKIKAMAQGQPPPEEKEVIKLGETPNSNTQRIKMNVNRSTTRPIEPDAAPVESQNKSTSGFQENAVPLEAKTEVAPETPVVVSDTNVQAKPEPEAIGKVSHELALLAKEKRALQTEREQLARDKEALTGQSSEALIKKLKTNPLSVLLENGVTYEQLTDEILKSQGNNEVAALKAEINSLTKSIDEKFQERDTQQEESVYGYMRQEVDKLSFSSNKYKLIREEKAQDKVMEFVKKKWKEDNEILTEEEAMDTIEGILREDARRYAKYIGELEETKTPEEPPPVQVTGQKTKTLTNKDSAHPPMSRRQRAIAAALGQK